MELKQAVAALTALAQESRLRVFRLLVPAGETGLPAGEIAERLDIPPATLTFHLKELSHAGLVESRREGRIGVGAREDRDVSIRRRTVREVRDEPSVTVINRRRAVRSNASSRRHRAIRPWSPDRRTSGTASSRHSAGLVYTGASSSPAAPCDSSVSESALPSTPGSRRVTASRITMTATSPPNST